MVIICTLVMAFSMTVCAHGAVKYTKYDKFKTGTVTTQTLCVRKDASKTSMKIGTVKSGKMLTLLGEKKSEDGTTWYRINYSGKAAFVSGKYVKKIKTASYRIYTPWKYGEVTSGPLNVRSSAGTKYKSYGTLKEGTKKVLFGYKETKSGTKWFRVKYGKKYGYISSSCVEVISKEKYEEKSSAEKGQEVVDYALRFVGKTPYRSGGSSLKSGADCSGFVMAIYKHFGYSLPNSSWGIEDEGRGVSRSSARATCRL